MFHKKRKNFFQFKKDEIEKKIEEAIANSSHLRETGQVANYIPELSNVNPNNFGISIKTINGDSYNFENFETKFSMQSISKIISLTMALEDNGISNVFSKVGTEHTKYNFNSIIPIHEKPSNPFINAGAITTISLINGNNIEEKFNNFLSKIKLLCSNEDIHINQDVFNSEMETNDINKSISYYLKYKNIIDMDPKDALILYTMACSISLTSKDLANLAFIFANCGKSLNNEQLIDENIVFIVLSQMSTSGMYNNSGRYLLEVGIPSKSGVGGGILAISPKKCGICVYSPRLDHYGNSVRGGHVLRELSRTLDLNIFL